MAYYVQIEASRQEIEFDAIVSRKGALDILGFSRVENYE